MSNTTLERALDLPGDHTAGDASDAADRQVAKPAKEAPTLSLSATAIAAGAMTATSSAMIGSHLGALGTLAGAATGSVIGAVLSALYSFGLQRAYHSVSTLRRRRGTLDHTSDGSPDETADAQPGRRPRRGFKPSPRMVKVAVGVLVMAAVTFGVTLLVITGFEKATGGSLSGVRAGTTIQQVTRPADQAERQDAASDPAQPAGPVPTPTPEPSATPSSTPSPSATPTSSTETPAPRATPSPTSPAVTTPPVVPTAAS